MRSIKSIKIILRPSVPKQKIVIVGIKFLLFVFLVISLDGKWDPSVGYPIAFKFNEEATLPQDYTWNIVWDSDGLVYLGRERLWRWNGDSFILLSSQNFRALRGMSFDREGRLWLAGINQFGAFDTKTGDYACHLDWIPPEYSPFGSAWVLHHDGESLWMGTDKRLFRFRSGDVQVWEFQAQHRVIFHFLTSGVFAHEAGVGLWRIDGKNCLLVNQNAILAEKSILYLEEFDDKLFGISSAGLFYLSLNGNSITEFFEVPELNNYPLSAVTRLSDSYLMVGSLGKGIFLVDNFGDSRILFNEYTSCFSKLILRFKKDSEGTIWVLSNESITKIYPNRNINLIDERLGITISRINDLSFNSGIVAVSTDSGFFDFDLKNNQTKIRNKSAAIISKKTISYKNTIFFSQYDRIYKIVDKNFVQIYNSGREIFTFTIDFNGYFYLSFSDEIGVFSTDEHGKLKLVKSIPIEGGFQKIDADSFGRVWGWRALSPLLEIQVDVPGGWQIFWHEIVGGLDLLRVDHEFTIMETGPVLSFIGQLAVFEKGNFWSFIPINSEIGVADAMTFRRMGDDLEGWLVYGDPVIGRNLVVEVTRKNGGNAGLRQLPWVDMNRIGKISTMAVTKESPFHFLIGGLKGLMVIGESLPDEIQPPSKPLIFDKSGRKKAPIEQNFNFGEEGPVFRFFSPSGSGEMPLRYQTRLSGRKAGWSEPSSLGRLEFGRIMEGRYELEVRALDAFGRQSEITSIRFGIAPPWYRGYLAYAFYATLLAFGGYGFIRFREGRLRERHTKLENLIEERTLEIRKANAFKDDFIANLSHEIRNPLNGVIGSIRQLKPNTILPTRYLEALKSAAQYLHSTVETVLDFSKLDSGNLEVDKTPFDIRTVVIGVLEIYREPADKKGLKLISEVMIHQGIGIESDSRKIQQIIGNLVGNAVKFTGKGEVHVHVSVISDSSGNELLLIRVKDTGPGIPKADQKKIFEKFYQGRTGISKTAGTGLGLTLVKQYTDCLGGSLRMDSEEGLGSTFWITLPIKLCSMPMQDESEDLPSMVLVGLTVLVVEDLEYNRIFLVDLLTELGCLVDCAGDGISGYEKALEGSYRVILLDWELPGMSGLDVARKLREEGYCPSTTRIVGMTAFASAENQRQCMEVGMDAFLPKPILRRNLLSILLDFSKIDGYIQDWGVLGEMGKSYGLKTTLGRWINYLHDYQSELEVALEEEDIEVVKKTAHRFLGHLRMIKLKELPETVIELLNAAHAGDWSGINEEWSRLYPMLNQFNEELSKVFLK